MDQGSAIEKKRRLIWLCKQFRNRLVPARNAVPGVLKDGRNRQSR
jgi:hypothetical protein